MLGTGYFLKIVQFNSQREKPICPNNKNQFFSKHKKSPIRKNKLPQKNFVPHGSSVYYKVYDRAMQKLIREQPLNYEFLVELMLLLMPSTFDLQTQAQTHYPGYPKPIHTNWDLINLLQFSAAGFHSFVQLPNGVTIAMQLKVNHM